LAVRGLPVVVLTALASPRSLTIGHSLAKSCKSLPTVPVVTAPPRQARSVSPGPRAQPPAPGLFGALLCQAAQHAPTLMTSAAPVLVPTPRVCLSPRAASPFPVVIRRVVTPPPQMRRAVTPPPQMRRAVTPPPQFLLAAPMAPTATFVGVSPRPCAMMPSSVASPVGSANDLLSPTTLHENEIRHRLLTTKQELLETVGALARVEARLQELLPGSVTSMGSPGIIGSSANTTAMVGQPNTWSCSPRVLTSGRPATPTRAGSPLVASFCSPMGHSSRASSRSASPGPAARSYFSATRGIPSVGPPFSPTPVALGQAAVAVPRLHLPCHGSTPTQSIWTSYGTPASARRASPRVIVSPRTVSPAMTSSTRLSPRRLTPNGGESRASSCVELEFNSFNKFGGGGGASSSGSTAASTAATVFVAINAQYPMASLINQIVDQLLNCPPPALAASMWTPAALKRHLSSIIIEAIGGGAEDGENRQRSAFFSETDRALIDALDSQGSWTAFDRAVRRSFSDCGVNDQLATQLLAAVRVTLALQHCGEPYEESARLLQKVGGCPSRVAAVNGHERVVRQSPGNASFGAKVGAALAMNVRSGQTSSLSSSPEALPVARPLFQDQSSDIGLRPQLATNPTAGPVHTMSSTSLTATFEMPRAPDDDTTISSLAMDSEAELPAVSHSMDAPFSVDSPWRIHGSEPPDSDGGDTSTTAPPASLSTLAPAGPSPATAPTAFAPSAAFAGPLAPAATTLVTKSVTVASPEVVATTAGGAGVQVAGGMPWTPRQQRLPRPPWAQAQRPPSPLPQRLQRTSSPPAQRPSSLLRQPGLGDQQQQSSPGPRFVSGGSTPSRRPAPASSVGLLDSSRPWRESGMAAKNESMKTGVTRPSSIAPSRASTATGKESLKDACADEWSRTMRRAGWDTGDETSTAPTDPPLASPRSNSGFENSASGVDKHTRSNEVAQSRGHATTPRMATNLSATAAWRQRADGSLRGVRSPSARKPVKVGVSPARSSSQPAVTRRLAGAFVSSGRRRPF